MKRTSHPSQKHAGSHYMCVTMGVIEKLQRDYFAGRDLGQSIPGMDATTAAVIVAESLEADRLINTPPHELFSRPFGPMSDWARTVLAEMFFEVARLAWEKEGYPGQERDFRALAWASLEEVLDSPAASPLLWYEDIFFHVGEELRVRGEPRAIEFFKRALAHNLRHNEGINVDSLLRDLAETYLYLGDLDAGLTILTALLRNDPGDVWTYNLMAITFDRFGLTEVGTEATRRGLELIEATGDPEKLRDQLLRCLGDMKQSERRGREADVDPAVLADLRAALALDFDAGEHRPVAELCRELVPDLDQVPVKLPPEKPDLPLPDELARR